MAISKRLAISHQREASDQRLAIGRDQPDRCFANRLLVLARRSLTACCSLIADR